MTPRPYKPRRAGKRWLEEAPEYILDVFDNKGNSDSIYEQQQSIDALWLYVQGIAAHINAGSSQENP